MIGSKAELEKKYAELLERYDSLYSDYSELNYVYGEMKVHADNIEKQDEEIRKLHESMRSLKHDMKNHLMVTLSYLNDGNEEAAKTYISHIIDKLNTIHSYIETGNSLLNHILNDKLSEARRNGIDIKAEVENLSFERMESMDFSALLSNMLDNAIEACLAEKRRFQDAANIAGEEGTDKSVPELIVKIYRNQGYEVIVVKNRISASVLDRNPELHTTKEDPEAHGKGVLQIRRIIEQYEGECDFYEEDGFFIACAFIPI